MVRVTIDVGIFSPVTVLHTSVFLSYLDPLSVPLLMKLENFSKDTRLTRGPYGRQWTYVGLRSPYPPINYFGYLQSEDPVSLSVSFYLVSRFPTTSFPLHEGNEWVCIYLGLRFKRSTFENEDFPILNLGRECHWFSLRELHQKIGFQIQ